MLEDSHFREKTPVFVRFSTVAGNKGSFDLARDVRGFAVKLYTQQGNWDLVGNNIPAFFIQDPMKFPDLVHAVKQEPDRGFPQAASAHDNFWDFISLMPESMHRIQWVMRGPREVPDLGLRSFPAPESGEKLRVRAESFADHFSQACQFYVSQTAVEQKHIRGALVFELSKVETPKARPST